jgi:hypothetical protein
MVVGAHEGDSLDHYLEREKYVGERGLVAGGVCCRRCE